jgi:Spy/CpxP family protein refolding chaperone
MSKTMRFAVSMSRSAAERVSTKMRSRLKRCAKVVKAVAALVLICGCIQASDVTSAAAQSTPPGSNKQTPQPTKAKLVRALDQLNLSPDQKAKVQSILDNQSLSPQMWMQQIKAVLTPEQREQLESKLQQDRQGSGGPGGSGGSGGQPPPHPQQ